MDFFGDDAAPAQPVQAASDPAADFLSGEQTEIANIEGAVYDEPPAAEASNGKSRFLKWLHHFYDAVFNNKSVEGIDIIY